MKTNLLVFIRPKIMRDAHSMSMETNSKYNQIRDMLEGDRRRGVALMPGAERPTIPPLEEQREAAPASETDE